MLFGCNYHIGNSILLVSCSLWKLQTEVDDIDWSAVDDLGCGIELEVSGDIEHRPPGFDAAEGNLPPLYFQSFFIVRIAGG